MKQFLHTRNPMEIAPKLKKKYVYSKFHNRKPKFTWVYALC